MRIGIMLSIWMVWFMRILSLLRYSAHSRAKPKRDMMMYRARMTVSPLREVETD